MTFVKNYDIVKLTGENKMKVKYETIKLNSEKNFQRAENLKVRGYKIISIGFETITLMKKGNRYDYKRN